ncbi:hypothetical protein B6S12_00775 [Helicobacter valdiviensis]|uniref:Uncharacterized protein n=1 Tax=Helicobacter valdiviensis TaxID=1458358 RepID=A0A2W6MYG6_9HELI|nr:hypothetical protein B6S12_00775 [Helicobacter valdiviensis]
MICLSLSFPLRKSSNKRNSCNCAGGGGEYYLVALSLILLVDFFRCNILSDSFFCFLFDFFLLLISLSYCMNFFKWGGLQTK